MQRLKKKAVIIWAKAYLWSACMLKKYDNKLAETLRRKLYRHIYHRVQQMAPPELYPGLFCEWYRYKTGKELNLNAPRGFCEKLQWLKLYDSTPLKAKLADKYLVREWVSDTIGGHYLVPLLGVWDKYDDINFDVLPEKFVLKTNHGSSMNYIVLNKNEMHHEEIKRKFSKWMSIDYGIEGNFELQYRNIPRKIIAEMYLEDDGGELYDYRFFCAHGKVLFYRITENSYSAIQGFSFDRNKKLLRTKYGKDGSDAVLRANETADIDEMWRLSEILAADFIFVRVDWYEVNGKLYFGEMTFTPSSGLFRWEDTYEMEFGKHLRLPIE